MDCIQLAEDRIQWWAFVNTFEFHKGMEFRGQLHGSRKSLSYVAGLPEETI